MPKVNTVSRDVSWVANTCARYTAAAAAAKAFTAPGTQSSAGAVFAQTVVTFCRTQIQFTMPSVTEQSQHTLGMKVRRENNFK